jgi:CHAT domain-containing protein/tetratricopeptide (TPR) repeat protein
MSLWSSIWNILSGKWSQLRPGEPPVEPSKPSEEQRARDDACLACEKARATVGEEDPAYARALTTLAHLYMDERSYARAEPLLRQAAEIHRVALGEAHPNYAQSLHNLANLYRLMGEVGRAERLYLRELQVRCEAQGEAHPEYARALHCLAVLYHLAGEGARAESLYLQAMEIRLTVLGAAHPHRLDTLRNLAALYQASGDHDRAEALLVQALETRRAALGVNNPYLAEDLRQLACLYLRSGDYAQVEPLFRQVTDLLRAANHALEKACKTALMAAPFGELFSTFMRYLEAVSTLATTCLSRGDVNSAEPLLRETLQIVRTPMDWTGLDRGAPVSLSHASLYAENLLKLALVCAATDRRIEASAVLRQAADAHDRLLGEAFPRASALHQAALLHQVQGQVSILLSLITSAQPPTPEHVRTGLDLLLRRKAIRAEVDTALHNVALVGRYPHLQTRLEELDALNTTAAQRILAGRGLADPETHLRQLVQWRERREELERELAHQIPELNLLQRLRAADRSSVARALPRGAALVEFVRYQPIDFKAVPGSWAERIWSPPRYLAFVLPDGEPDQARLVELGDSEQIDRLVAGFRSGLTGEFEHHTLPQPADRGRADPRAGHQLREAVFDPLRPALSGRRWLVLAPNGDLTRLPFGILPLRERRLLDEYRISYLSTGRDVLRFQVRSGCQPGQPLVIADPDFDLGGMDPGVTRSLGLWSRDLARDRYHFTRLPGSRLEGERVARRLGVSPALAADAMEGVLKHSRSPRILHLATHGFFLPDQRSVPQQLFARNLELKDDADAAGFGRLSGPGMEDPMLRSGLAMAGANTFLKGGTPPEKAEDGLLTAADVAGLDLRDTELVVLSACETGLGAVHVGEGVFGLRRAFSVAGAKTLVMSLWKVPDLATTFLMDRLYDNLLTRVLHRDLALSEAQRATRDVTVVELRAEWLSGTMIERLAAGDVEARRALEELARQPDGHRPFEHPFYWGAFICQGDTAPLPGMDPGSG